MKKVDILIKKIMEAKRLARELNRFQTFHALDKAEKVAGYELADVITGKQKIGVTK